MRSCHMSNHGWYDLPEHIFKHDTDQKGEKKLTCHTTHTHTSTTENLKYFWKCTEVIHL